ncbi:acetyl-CoA carboxylase biotin carboxyl carrier protein [Paraburkholderia sp. GAS199]|uniref:acetyl-CoA carboxylase biotin carboxyl carrier protein n=1 Tax=Paraburkholderia sp. GAS199 TaxID=3035126 RepID=UPI003D1F028D
MDHDTLNRLLQLIERTSVTELECTVDNWKVKLVRAANGVSADASTRFAESASADVPLKIDDPVPAKQSQHVISAGLTGTFYRAPAPDQAPFVCVGDVVQVGQTVGVVEAMKLLNTIEADCSGRVVSIFAEDGAAVAPDSKLIGIEPLEASHV